MREKLRDSMHHPVFIVRTRYRVTVIQVLISGCHSSPPLISLHRQKPKQTLPLNLQDQTTMQKIFRSHESDVRKDSLTLEGNIPSHSIVSRAEASVSYISFS